MLYTSCFPFSFAQIKISVYIYAWHCIAVHRYNIMHWFDNGVLSMNSPTDLFCLSRRAYMWWCVIIEFGAVECERVSNNKWTPSTETRALAFSFWCVYVCLCVSVCGNCGSCAAGKFISNRLSCEKLTNSAEARRKPIRSSWLTDALNGVCVCLTHTNDKHQTLCHMMDI